MTKKNIYFDPNYKLIIKDPQMDGESFLIKNLFELKKVYELTNTQITFNVTKTTSNSANTAKITIVNPPLDLDNLIRNYNGRKPFVELHAGWGEEADVIFKGSIEKTSGSDNGVDRELNLTCADGATNQRESITKRWYPKGTSLNLIFDELLKDTSCTKGFVYDFTAPDTRFNIGNSIYTAASPITIRTAKSFSGNTNSILRELGQTYGLDVFITDGVMYIIPPDMVINTTTYTTISPDTGLIGSPIADSNGTTLNNNTTTTKQAIKFDCLLNTEITVGGSVNLKSERFNGVYKVTKIEHIGSYEGSEWKTSVWATATDYKLVKSSRTLTLISPTITIPALKEAVTNVEDL